MSVYFRTLDELLAPLQREDPQSAGGFAVERAEALKASVPFLVELRRGGALAAYAGAYTSCLRAVTEPVVRAALERPEAGTRIVDCLYERIRDRVLAEPERYTFWPITVVALLTPV
jgi:hypothetical protein